MIPQMAVHALRLAIQLVLLPLVAMAVPVVFALAWLREACSDLTARA